MRAYRILFAFSLVAWVETVVGCSDDSSRSAAPAPSITESAEAGTEGGSEVDGSGTTDGTDAAKDVAPGEGGSDAGPLDGAFRDGDEGDAGGDPGVDAGPLANECTGSKIPTSTTVERLRVHPDGSLFALADGALYKFSVDTTGGGCALATAAGWQSVAGVVRSFDLDGAGNLFAVVQTGGNVVFGRHDATTGAPTPVSCGLLSAKAFGHLAVTPDGASARVVTRAGAANQSADAFDIAVGANTCFATQWSAPVCGVGQPVTQALRADAANTFVACPGDARTYAPGAATPTFSSTKVGMGAPTDLGLNGGSFDLVDRTNRQFHRFDRATGTFVATYFTLQVLGAAAQTLRPQAMTDAASGYRYVSVSSPNDSSAYRILRVADF